MPTEQSPVLCLVDTDDTEVSDLLARFGMQLVRCAPQESIPGSYWGDDEAGLMGDRLYARADTPLHSILHEACHYICVSAERRRQLDTNAASDEAEEAAVCYLQVLLAEQLSSMGRARMFADMDAWGYSFRLGSSQRWFETDAEDALAWLIQQQLVDRQAQPLWRLRC
jgi:phage gp46-like protein